MSETVVRVLAEHDWDVYRSLRLAGLQDSPEAFVESYAEEVGRSPEWWRRRMRRASRLLVEYGAVPRGIASCAVVDGDPTIAEVFGLWVDPATRQAGLAWSLMEAATKLATTHNWAYLYYWVGTENTRAIAFASNFGFRPSPDRRSARLPRAGFGAMEIAMVLPVGSDPAAVPNPTLCSFAAPGGPSD